MKIAEVRLEKKVIVFKDGDRYNTTHLTMGIVAQLEDGDTLETVKTQLNAEINAELADQALKVRFTTPYPTTSKAIEAREKEELAFLRMMGLVSDKE